MSQWPYWTRNDAREWVPHSIKASNPDTAARKIEVKISKRQVKGLSNSGYVGIAKTKTKSKVRLYQYDFKTSELKIVGENDVAKGQTVTSVLDSLVNASTEAPAVVAAAPIAVLAPPPSEKLPESEKTVVPPAAGSYRIYLRMGLTNRWRPAPEDVSGTPSAAAQAAIDTVQEDVSQVAVLDWKSESKSWRGDFFAGPTDAGRSRTSLTQLTRPLVPRELRHWVRSTANELLGGQKLAIWPRTGEAKVPEVKVPEVKIGVAQDVKIALPLAGSYRVYVRIATSGKWELARESAPGPSLLTAAQKGVDAVPQPVTQVAVLKWEEDVEAWRGYFYESKVIGKPISQSSFPEDIDQRSEADLLRWVSSTAGDILPAPNAARPWPKTAPSAERKAPSAERKAPKPKSKPQIKWTVESRRVYTQNPAGRWNFLTEKKSMSHEAAAKSAVLPRFTQKVAVISWSPAGATRLHDALELKMFNRTEDGSLDTKSAYTEIVIEVDFIGDLTSPASIRLWLVQAAARMDAISGPAPAPKAPRPPPKKKPTAAPKKKAPGPAKKKKSVVEKEVEDEELETKDFMEVLGLTGPGKEKERKFFEALDAYLRVMTEPPTSAS